MDQEIRLSPTTYFGQRKVHRTKESSQSLRTTRGLEDLQRQAFPGADESAINEIEFVGVDKENPSSIGLVVAGFNFSSKSWSFDVRIKYTYFLCLSSGMSGIENLTPKL